MKKEMKRLIAAVLAALMLAGCTPSKKVTESVKPAQTGSVETDPKETLPERDTEPTVPTTTVPVETVPATTVPVETVPATTVPVETVPATTAPVETVPATITVSYLDGTESQTFAMKLVSDDTVSLSLDEFLKNPEYKYAGTSLVADYLPASPYLVDASNCSCNVKKFKSPDGEVVIATLYNNNGEEAYVARVFHMGERDFTHIFGKLNEGMIDFTYTENDGELLPYNPPVAKVVVEFSNERTANKNSAAVNYEPPRWQRRNVEHGRDPFYRPNTHKLVRKRFK